MSTFTLFCVKCLLGTYFNFCKVLEYNCGDIMNLFSDIFTFFKILSIVDIIFLIAIVALLILIVTLIYFIKINKEVLDENDFFPPSSDNQHKDEEKKDELIEKIENVQAENFAAEEYNDEEGELLDLESLTQKLKNEENVERISCTEYEKDQEEKAIISYDELLQKHNRYALNYEKEEVIDDLIVKKVNLNDLVNKNEEEKVVGDVRVISYQKEEAFLNALKELNSLLN